MVFLLFHYFLTLTIFCAGPWQTLQHTNGHTARKSLRFVAFPVVRHHYYHQDHRHCQRHHHQPPPAVGDVNTADVCQPQFSEAGQSSYVYI